MAPFKLLAGLAAVVQSEHQVPFPATPLDERTPGGFTSFSESLLKKGTAAFVPKIVDELKSLVIPGVNQSIVKIAPIRFEDVSIGSYDVSVLPKKGVEISLKDMSNTIAHTDIVVDLKLLTCKGQVWAFNKGASYSATNKIVVDESGDGKLSTETEAFDPGTIQIHHQMQGFVCEASADVLHVVNSVLIDLVKKELKAHLGSIIAKAIDFPVTKFLHVLEQPPAIGLGKEKFKLDNSYLTVNYDNKRISHLHKGEFKSTLHPVESALTPPPMGASGSRDVQFGFSDYVINTLFDAMFAEHIGESQFQIPFIKTIFDKECPKCPIVLKNTFGSAARQTFENGKAAAHLNDVTLEIGALNNASQGFGCHPRGGGCAGPHAGWRAATVLPMVTLSVNSSFSSAFSLEETKDNYGVRVKFGLEDLSQTVVISHIGKIDMSDLSRDLKLLISNALDKVNQELPALPLPPVAGMKLAKPVFSTNNRILLLEADVVMPSAADVAVIIV